MNSVLRCVEKEPPVDVIVRRALVPVVLLIAGFVALVEGMLFHPIRVLVEEETQTTIEVPLPSLGSPMDEPSPSDGPPEFPRGMPFGGPTFIKKAVTRVDLVPIMISEPDATRDVTVGGLVRLDSDEHAGELKRTYSGKGPALCPT